MLRELTEALDVITRATPLVIVLEDLHWSDVSTLDLVGALARRPEPARLLLVATCRPEETLPRGTAVPALIRDLEVRRVAVEIALPSLAPAAVDVYLQRRFPGAVLPPGLATAVHRRTDGHPLFMVAMAEHWIAREMLVAVGSRWTARAEIDALESDVPADVRTMIEARVLRLPDDERRLVEAASVVGTELSAASVAAALDAALPQVDEGLAALAHRGMILRRHADERWLDGTVAGRYVFTHALYREVIYERVPVARRAEWHARVGAREERGHGADVGTIAARLAMHFEQAGDPAGAVRYRLQACRNAGEVGAHREAITHATAGLASIARLPAGRPRDEQELGLQLALATALSYARGYSTSETERAYARVLALGGDIGDTPESALKSVYLFYLRRGELEKAQAVAEQVLSRAVRAGDTALRVWAHMTVGVALVPRGLITRARTQFEEGLVHYAAGKEPTGLYATQHHPAVVCRSFLAWCLWLLGLPAQAVKEDDEALRLAEAAGHPLTHAQALGCSATMHVFRRDARRVGGLADRATALSIEHGLTYWRLVGMLERGWARAVRGDSAAGVAEVREALDALGAIGNQGSGTLHCWMLADALGLGGRLDEAQEALATAAEVARRNGEHFWEPEIHRLDGELHLQRAEKLANSARARAIAAAATALQQALTLARAQEARSLELRAAMSLCRLSRHTGDRASARSTLAEVHASFTEGFETHDLKEARALLRDTGGTSS
jgi:predicted ATPase